MKKLAASIGVATFVLISHPEAREITAQECLAEIGKVKQAEEKRRHYSQRYQETKTVESRCEFIAEGITYFKQVKKTAESCMKHEPEQAGSLHATAVEVLGQFTPELKKCSAEVALERKCLSALDRVRPLRELHEEKAAIFNKGHASAEEKRQAGCEMLKAGLAYFKEVEKASRVCEPLDPEKAGSVYAGNKTVLPQLLDSLNRHCKGKPARQGA